jgi:cytochrome c-type biogenesis protein CcmF
MVVIAFGVLGSSVYSTKVTATLNQGESTTLSGYTVTVKSLIPSSTTNMVLSADLEISHNGKVVAELFPKDIYNQSFGWWVNTSIRSSLFRDIWVSMENFNPNTGDLLQTPIYTVQISPLVTWIWIGGFILLIGGLVSFSARSPQPEDDEKASVIKKKL